VSARRGARPFSLDVVWPMKTHIAGIIFADAQRIALLVPVLIGIVGLLVYRLMHSSWAIRALAGTKIALAFRNLSLPRKRLQAGLLTGAAVLLALALLRPQWNKREEIVTQEGRDLFIALDISRSMLATDCEPNRLECAKQKVKQLLATLTCERVGLILFSGSAFVQCPLTSDFVTFKTFLDHVNVETISSGTTALDQAVKTALETFGHMEGKKNKLIALFTDGEDFSRELRRYKQQAHEQGLRIFTFGVGTAEGAPIPLYDEDGTQIGHQKNRSGNVVISRLNEGILQTLAQDAGGVYLQMTEDTRDVQTLVHQVQSFETEMLEDKSYSAYEDQYHWFLLGSFILFALEWIIA